MTFNISADQKILSNEAPLVIPPQLAAILGRTETTVLHQIHYWLQRSKNWVDGLCWVYKTYQQWAAEIPFLSERTIRRAIRTLESYGILKSERMEAHHWNQRKWYTICYDTLETYVFQRWPNCPDRIGQNDQVDAANMASSYTKNTPIELKTTDRKDLSRSVSEGINKEKVNHESQTHRGDDRLTSPMLKSSEEAKLDKPQTLESSPKFSTGIKKDIEIEQQVKDAIAPCPFNGQLKRLVLDTGADLVVDAIRVVKQARKNHKVKNPAGLFRRAIERQWKPGDGFDDSAISNEFNEWFKLARKADLVMSSQFHNGQLWVFNPQAERLTYEEMLRRYPLESLKQTSEKSQVATKGVKTSPAKTSVKPASFPVDLSEVLTAIDIQLSRLGWGQEQVKAFLKQMYGQPRRSLLRDEELIDFKEQLLAL